MMTRPGGSPGRRKGRQVRHERARPDGTGARPHSREATARARSVAGRSWPRVSAAGGWVQPRLDEVRSTKAIGEPHDAKRDASFDPPGPWGSARGFEAGRTFDR